MNVRLGSLRSIGPTVDPLDIAALHPAIVRRGLSRADLEEIQSVMRSARQADVSIAGIVRWVAAETGLSESDILGRRAHHTLSSARALACWGARHALRRSYPRIARGMARDHSTVFHAIRKAEHLREIDPAFRALSEQLLATFAKEPRA